MNNYEWEGEYLGKFETPVTDKNLFCDGLECGFTFKFEGEVYRGSSKKWDLTKADEEMYKLISKLRDDND